ncbi:MAG: YdeI/OmpD-associated family protein [Rhodobacteraceae bacterium]|nr:YdeI/OmpD-associated family protein [Paracoccaceae bacterium]
MITDPGDYFAKGCGRCDRFATPECSTRRWAAGLAALRRICLEAGLTETAKWGHPCYMHGGRNIALIGAFRDDFRLTFFEPALMTDPEGVLEKQGPNARHAGTLRFTANDTPGARERLIRAYLEEAMSHAAAGLKAPKEPAEFDLPEELTEALDSDAELAEAFHALTPGRQRSYAINLASAKSPETRYRRIAGFRGKIFAGKGASER